MSWKPLQAGVRWMMRRPLVSLTCAICLGAGIAATAVAVTLLDAGVRRPFGLGGASRLAVVWETNPARNQPLVEVSYLNFLDWQREARTVESMAAFGSSHWPGLARMDGESVPLALRGVSATFFPTLGVAPSLGRNFDERDLRPDAPAPLLLSHRLWQARWGGSSAVVGQEVFIDGNNHVIVGVMPAGFAYPDDPDGWIAVERVLGVALQDMPLDNQRRLGVLEVLVRRHASASLDDVRGELTGIIQDLQRQYSPDPSSTLQAAATPFADVVLGQLGARIWIALGMGVAVFLLACANVGAVRAAQLREREGEMTARLFLGCTRTRLIRDVALEVVPLALIGTTIAGGITWTTLQALSTSTVVSTSGIALMDHVTGAVGWVVGLGTLAALLVGVVPAGFARWRVTEGSQPTGRSTWRTSRVGAPLLFGQAATTIAVVTLAGVALGTFTRLSSVDVGFATSGVTFVDIAIPGWKYETSQDAQQLVGRLESELRTLSGVRRVAAVSVRPFRFAEIADGLPVRRSGDALVQPETATGASRVAVTPDYFNALGQPLVAGRAFTDADRAGNEPVAIVSRTLARTFFGDVDPIGQSIDTFSLSNGWRPRRIVGVASDARYRGLERPSLEVYVPSTQVATGLGSLVIASDAPVSGSDLRRLFQRVDPDVAIERLQSTSDVRNAVLAPARLLATIVSTLGGAGLLLLVMGMFGATAAALRSAWTEIAVRQAIGAQPLQAAHAPLGQLTRALAAGIVTGIALTPVVLSAAAAVGLSTDDRVGPIVLATALVMTAALAAVAPSLWRAARVPPSVLLRQG